MSPAVLARHVVRGAPRVLVVGCDFYNLVFRITMVARVCWVVELVCKEVNSCHLLHRSRSHMGESLRIGAMGDKTSLHFSSTLPSEAKCWFTVGRIAP